MTTIHNADGSGGYNGSYALMTDADPPHAQLFRVPLEQLADNLDFTVDQVEALFAVPVETPEAYAEIRDDFIGCEFDPSTDILHSDYPWQVTSSSAAVSGSDSGNRHPGMVYAPLIADAEFEMELAGANTIRWGDLVNATLIARVTSTDLTDAEFFVGFAENVTVASVGNNAVGLWFDHGTNASEWLIRHKVGGVDDATVPGVAVVSSAWVKIKLLRVSSTQVEVRLNDDLVATLTDGVDAPADASILTAGMFAKAGSAATMTPALDLVYVRWVTALGR